MVKTSSLQNRQTSYQKKIKKIIANDFANKNGKGLTEVRCKAGCGWWWWWRHGASCCWDAGWREGRLKAY